ncbi:hypothetical protein [Halomarina ordinaria]|uniref:Domain of unknown function domain-containing protein n=1 Tax=Halomarina ordinaria TaxID=3033939 RepID=A0ABD5U5L5_9EURY|nr:hypothetical protein [Halomarina sp. PSRA2]
MASRKNAMLTTEDRRWLTGEKVYEGEHAKQQRYQRRRDIRERIRNALLDFTTLFEHLDADERAKLFGDRTTGGDLDTELTEGITDAVAFLLYNTGFTRAIGGSTVQNAQPTLAEQVLDEAIRRAGRRDDLLVTDVSVDVEATRTPPERLLAALQAGEDLTRAELRYLLDSDLVDETDLQACLRQVLVETDDAPGDHDG